MAVIIVKKYRILMDDEDYERIQKFSANSIRVMQGNGKSNPHACISRTPAKGEKVELHYLSRLIMKVTDSSKRVIFRNDNTLDLRRDNLVVVDAAQASRKRVKTVSTSSQYLGVHWAAHAGKWRAFIKPNSQSSPLHLGYFVKEEEAAEAYDKAAKKHFGKLAHINFPGLMKPKKKAAKKKTA